MKRDAQSHRRLWLFRLIAIALGPGLLAGLELLCRWFQWGGRPVEEDPFVGFKSVHPLFELNEGKGRYEVASAKLKFFSPEAFPVQKVGFRVFCLGGSTVKGRPYSKETAFSTWLELGLSAAQPDRRWEVINCGGISYASYRLVNLLRECLRYEPDLFVICTGHNEFLEDRTYEHLRDVPEVWAESMAWAGRLHLYRLARQFLQPLEADRKDVGRFEMTTEVEALLDYRGGLEVYDRNERWRDDVVRHFDHNIRSMVRMARSSGVPVLLVRPPSDLRSTPPFKSQHREDLSLDDRMQWQAAVHRARDAFGEDLQRSVQEFRRALQIDDRHAGLHYEVARCYEALGRPPEARAAYHRALEEDVCPLRMIDALDGAMRRIAGEESVPLVDAHALLEGESHWQILGSDQLVDHIHPSIEGHQKIAGALLQRMVEGGFCQPETGWEERREQLYRKQRESLDAAYFATARRALHGLREWAAGRTQGPPIESRPSARGR